MTTKETHTFEYDDQGRITSETIVITDAIKPTESELQLAYDRGVSIERERCAEMATVEGNSESRGYPTCLALHTLARKIRGMD